MKKQCLLIVLIPFFTHTSCNNHKKMTESKVLTYQQVINYLNAYSNSERVNLSACLIINNKDKIRGIIGAAEFEFIAKQNLLIIRGLVDKRINEGNIKFKEKLLHDIKQMYLQNHGYFKEYLVEHDTTAYELNSEFPERLNIRFDLTKADINDKDFVNFVEEMMIFTYRFNHDKYDPLFEKVYQELIK